SCGKVLRILINSILSLEALQLFTGRLSELFCPLHCGRLEQARHVLFTYHKDRYTSQPAASLTGSGTTKKWVGNVNGIGPSLRLYNFPLSARVVSIKQFLRSGKFRFELPSTNKFLAPTFVKQEQYDGL